MLWCCRKLQDHYCNFLNLLTHAAVDFFTVYTFQNVNMVVITIELILYPPIEKYSYW